MTLCMTVHFRVEGDSHAFALVQISKGVLKTMVAVVVGGGGRGER